MKISKEKLLQALEAVKPGLSNKEMIEQSTSFAFIGDKICTYNDEISVSHTLDELNLTGAIDAISLYAIISKLKNDELTFEKNDNEIIITSGKVTVGMVLEQEIKLPLDEIKGEKEWHDIPLELLDAIDFVKHATGNDMLQPVLTTIHINKNGNVEASDGFRLCKVHINNDLDTFLLPIGATQHLKKLNPKSIAFSTGWTHFKNDIGTVFSCRILNDKFPETSKLYKISGEEIEFPKNILDVLEKARIFTSHITEFDETVNITMKERKTIIESKSDTGWFKEIVNSRYKGNEIIFNITPVILQDILKREQKCIISENKLKFIGDNWEYITMLKTK